MASPDGEDWCRYAGPGDPRVRASVFLKAFLDAPSNADIEIRGGRDESGAPAMVIRLAGIDHAFTIVEARTVTDIAEDTMRVFPSEAHVWGNLIVAVRAAADKIEQAGRL